MQEAVAANLARNTREQAESDARRDLQGVRQKAIEAGIERSRRVFKTTIIDRRNGTLRYNPAGRILRDWYLHVYMNGLRANLGEPNVVIDAQQIEDTTAHLGRVRPGVNPLSALRSVAATRDIAIADAAHATLEAVETLDAVAGRRAIRVAPDERFGGHELSVHITRHWYQRCYKDQVQGATQTRQPFTEVTTGEEHAVALCLAAGESRRLLSPAGVPLMTRHGTVATDFDRSIGGGQPGVASPVTDPVHHSDPEIPLRLRIERTWRDLDTFNRRHWLELATHRLGPAPLSWGELADQDQQAIIRLYLSTHRPDQIGVAFSGEVLSDSPSKAAATMFAHRQELPRSGSGTSKLLPHEESSPYRSEADDARPCIRSRST